MPVWNEQAEIGTVTERANITLTVYRTEPLMRLIAKLRFTPITLGLAFLFVISLVLTFWADQTTPPDSPPPEDSNYLSYFKNISWSISILYLFPFVVALTLQYYQTIPRLFEYLFNDIVGKNTNHQDRKEFYQWLDKRFNFPHLWILFLSITLLLNWGYFYQISEELSWMTIHPNEILKSILKVRLSPIGQFAAVIQIVLIYWVFNLLYRGSILAWGLHEFFNRRNFNINIDPLHPDGCCGLRPIGSTAMLLNMILFILGIYVSLKVIDKIVIQEGSLADDIGNPMMLGSYVIIAPLLFFFPLSSAHKKMREAKIRFILPVSQRCEVLFAQLTNQNLDNQGMSAVKTYSQINKIRTEMKREIAVWPFDFRSVQAFLATVVVPVLPVVLPFVAKLIELNLPE